MASVVFLGLLLLAVAAHGGRQSTSLLGDDHFVTMTKEEIYEIIYCVSSSRDVKARQGAEQCMSLAPRQTSSAFEQCRQAPLFSNGFQRFYDSMAAHPQIILEMYECLRQNTSKYTKKEAAQMVQFEKCSRVLYAATSPLCRNRNSLYYK